MLLGKYVITRHAIEQYEDRIREKRFDDTRKCIRNDLKTLNIRRIVRIGDKTHVFTKGYREFIFTTETRKNSQMLILKTIIKRNFDSQRETIEIREAQKVDFERRSRQNA